MKRPAIAVCVLLAQAAIATTGALAQEAVRVRGTIAALEGDTLSVKSRDGGDLKLQLASKLGVSTAKAATLEELKGKYVGVTAVERGGRMLVVERINVSKDGVKPPH